MSMKLDESTPGRVKASANAFEPIHKNMIKEYLKSTLTRRLAKFSRISRRTKKTLDKIQNSFVPYGSTVFVLGVCTS